MGLLWNTKNLLYLPLKPPPLQQPRCSSVPVTRHGAAWTHEHRGICRPIHSSMAASYIGHSVRQPAPLAGPLMSSSVRLLVLLDLRVPVAALLWLFNGTLILVCTLDPILLFPGCSYRFLGYQSPSTAFFLFLSGLACITALTDQNYCLCWI